MLLANLWFCEKAGPFATASRYAFFRFQIFTDNAGIAKTKLKIKCRISAILSSLCVYSCNIIQPKKVDPVPPSLPFLAGRIAFLRVCISPLPACLLFGFIQNEEAYS
jgi:hypothetical protein